MLCCTRHREGVTGDNRRVVNMGTVLNDEGHELDGWEFWIEFGISHGTTSIILAKLSATNFK